MTSRLYLLGSTCIMLRSVQQCIRAAQPRSTFNLHLDDQQTLEMGADDMLKQAK